MNVKTLIIRFGIGTLVAFSAAASAQEYVVDLAAAEIVSTSSDSVSADIAARHQPFTEVRDGEALTADRRYNELKLADEMARQLSEQLDRRLQLQLGSVI